MTTASLTPVATMTAQPTAAAQEASAPVVSEPAYVVRGKQAEVHQRALRERVERFHQTLTTALKTWAPDLLKSLEPPPPGVFGYQILPRIIADRPPGPPAKPQVVSYSWKWSETLIERQMIALDRLEIAFAQVAQTASTRSRAAYETMVADYKKIVVARRPIDADIDYNWLWQERIARDRPLFDRLTARLSAVSDRLTESWPVIREAGTPVNGFDPPSFVRVEHPTDDQWLVTVPIYTDITDPDFVERVRTSIEEHWYVRSEKGDFRVRLEVTALPPERLYCPDRDSANPPIEHCAPPTQASHIDLTKHSARFPKDGAVLTTGAASLRIVGGTTLVLGPHDVAPRVLAHEFGHILGFPDSYLRGYRDLGSDGFQVMELVADPTDIMSSPGSGSVLMRHVDGLFIAKAARLAMQAGLSALYEHKDAPEAIIRFREVLTLNPSHFGATLQLAKALDQAGLADEALVTWRKMLDMAEAAGNTATAALARARLADVR